EFNNVSQLVAVEAGTLYRLECYIRTEDLKSAATPVIEIVDSANGTALGVSAPFPVGKNDWQSVTVDFKTSATTEAVTVRTGRASCGADTVCPIFGKVWYDDFNLQRVGGSVDARDGGANRTGARAIAR
ncbi:MAG TPA: hypothetical protein VD966_02920, partial [Pyrinomonadaceae bacterium]|nr:hypothetical protein [Pyrinomonadaceae bacterium]